MTPAVEELELLAMHPHQWHTQAPEELIVNYSYGNPNAVAIGCGPQVGWFVLQKEEDGTKSILYMEKKVLQFTPPNPDPALKGLKYAINDTPRPLSLPEVTDTDIVISTRVAIKTFSIAPQTLHEVKIGARGTYVSALGQIAFKRLSSHLYKIYDFEKLPEDPL